MFIDKPLNPFKSRQHTSVKISELVDDMKQEYDQMLLLASKEVTRISKLEKLAMVKLTENEEINAELAEQVDRVVQKQVLNIYTSV